MKILFSSISLTSILILSGCGSSALSERNSLNDDIKENSYTAVHKLKKANWNSVDDLGNGYNQRSGLIGYTYGTQSFVIKLEVEEGRKDLAAHTQFFINSDNDTSTGFQSKKKNSLGIEYIIEDDKLYKYIGDGQSFDWEFVENVKYKRYNNTVIVGIEDYKSIGLHAGYNKISISAANIDENWKTIDVFGKNGGRAMASGNLFFSNDNNSLDKRQSRGWFDFWFDDEPKKENDGFWFDVDEYPDPEPDDNGSWFSWFDDEPKKEKDDFQFDVDEYPDPDPEPDFDSWFDWF